MNQKVVLITGCSSGIGLSLAARIAKDEKKRFMVSNAGMGLIGPIECQSIDEMKTVMDTNFFGLVRLLKEILPDMKKRKKGHIVVISSVMGIQGILFNDVYAASKFAVEGFCESLAIQALRFNLK
ncbi:retinol dehydrogenase 8-like [Oryzias melastigma]|uniref:retinol dehydrogenase 8-like n=1 Tax=Oryzias melastigma TaxID=30732 RepID=UPI00168D58B8|nr:retinol dehydrogenase 8-like [Oryzias melastigma]